MTIFTYIASNDPDAARAICNKYGYEIQNVGSDEDMGQCLQQLVAEEGEPAMLDIYAIHPDKDQLLLLYGNKSASGPEKKGDCGCNKKSQKSMSNYLSQVAGTTNNQIQLCIVVAAVLLSAAIISKS